MTDQTISTVASDSVRAVAIRSALEGIIEIRSLLVSEVDGQWDGEIVTAPISDEATDAALELVEQRMNPLGYHVYDFEPRDDNLVLYFNTEDVPQPDAASADNIVVTVPDATPSLTDQDTIALGLLREAISGLSPQARAAAIQQGILTVGATPATKSSGSKKAQGSVAPRVCLCGCGKLTRGGNFIPGHDATLKGRLQRLSQGKLRQDELSFRITPEIEQHIRNNPLWLGWFGALLNK